MNPADPEFLNQRGFCVGFSVRNAAHGHTGRVSFVQQEGKHHGL